MFLRSVTDQLEQENKICSLNYICSSGSGVHGEWSTMMVVPSRKEYLNTAW